MKKAKTLYNGDYWNYWRGEVGRLLRKGGYGHWGRCTTCRLGQFEACWTAKKLQAFQRQMDGKKKGSVLCEMTCPIFDAPRHGITTKIVLDFHRNI